MFRTVAKQQGHVLLFRLDIFKASLINHFINCKVEGVAYSEESSNSAVFDVLVHNSWST